MSAKRFGGRRARFEALESKQLLAGDVFVSVVGGNLVVAGDEAGNQVAITSGAEPGEYVIRGLDGTNIVQSTDPAVVTPPVSEVVVTGVTRGARIGLGAGDDTLVMSDVGFRGSVNVGMGEGNDTVSIGLRPDSEPRELIDSTTETEPAASVRIGGSLRIGAGADDDAVRIDHTVVGGRLSVRGGAGEDVVRLGHPMPPAEENPTAAVADTPAPEETPRAVHVGRGVHVNLGAGHDEFFANSVKTNRGFYVNGGLGDDGLHANHIWAGGPLVLRGGGGDGADNVDLAHSRARTAVIATGEGNDHVRIADSVFRGLGVALGAGDDTLDLHGNTAHWAFFLGGAGTDAIDDLGGNEFGHRFVRGFEPMPAPPEEVGTEVA